ncbi:hypothetical protein KR222_004458 [Zaprionus bogoriensis]|nr:hypothetical protein KR222_004458 [Zaprionus bogoriensis]
MHGVLGLLLLLPLIAQANARDLTPNSDQVACVSSLICEELQLHRQRFTLCCMLLKLFDKQQDCQSCERPGVVADLVNAAIEQCQVGCGGLRPCCNIDPVTKKCKRMK